MAPIFGRAAITLGIGPHSSLHMVQHDAIGILSFLASLKTRTVYFLMQAYPGCAGKEAVKQVLLLFV